MTGIVFRVRTRNETFLLFTRLLLLFLVTSIHAEQNMRIDRPCEVGLVSARRAIEPSSR